MFLLRDDISEIIRVLESGGIICYPTDTIWGLGCDPFNEQAMERLSRIRGGISQGYILLVSSVEMLKQYVPKIHPRLETLLHYHQRPLTVVYERSVGSPSAAKAPDGSIAIRLVQDEFCQQLIQEYGKPLVSAAAAKIGEAFPATFGSISSEILQAADYVVKHRQDDKTPGEPSSIAKLDRHMELEFLRE